MTADGRAERVPPARTRGGDQTSGSGAPVSSNVLRLDRMLGQPWLTPARTALPDSKPPWVTVSLTIVPAGSMSNVTWDSGSAGIAAHPSSAPPSAPVKAGVITRQVYDSRRGGSAASTIWPGSATVTPASSQVTGDPVCQSDVSATPQ